MCFFEVVGRVIHELPEYGTPRLYGEMVSLLWAGGNIAGAIALEGLWNRLAGIYDFKLLCAYPLSLFNPASDSTAFWEVCGDHTEVRLRFADIPPFDNDLGSLKEVLRNVQRMESLSRGRLVAEPGAAGFLRDEKGQRSRLGTANGGPLSAFSAIDFFPYGQSISWQVKSGG